MATEKNPPTHTERRKSLFFFSPWEIHWVEGRERERIHRSSNSRKSEQKGGVRWELRHFFPQAISPLSLTLPLPSDKSDSIFSPQLWTSSTPSSAHVHQHAHTNILGLCISKTRHQFSSLQRILLNDWCTRVLLF